jgi:hypothetical protein
VALVTRVGAAAHVLAHMYNFSSDRIISSPSCLTFMNTRCLRREFPSRRSDFVLSTQVLAR